MPKTFEGCLISSKWLELCFVTPTLTEAFRFIHFSITQIKRSNIPFTAFDKQNDVREINFFGRMMCEMASCRALYVILFPEPKMIKRKIKFPFI